MKKRTILSILLPMTLALSACSGAAAGLSDTLSAAQVNAASAEESVLVSSAQQTSVAGANQISVEYDSEELDASYNDAEATTIALEGDAIRVEGSGAVASGSVVTITNAGTYSISGILHDGQVIVDTQDVAAVKIVLNGVDISSSTSAPIYVSRADKTILTLAEGTENVITDGQNYLLAEGEDEPNAAVFSKDDLTINGSGSLTVNASFNNGIASKDDLKIMGGTITVNAVNDGIKGRDSIAVRDGVITVYAGGDGLQANNDEDAEEGAIIIEGGQVTIEAALDGIQAETSLAVSGGEVAITAGGGSVNTTHTAAEGQMGRRPVEETAVEEDTAESAKGLKAGVDIAITGGVLNINAADDAIHSNGSLTISGGDIVLSSGDDGLRADNLIMFNDGVLNIVESYESIESGVIIINDGTIHLAANDDGINVTSGSGEWGGPEQAVSSEYYLEINGGYLYVDANGDGLDSNGVGTMNGGTVIVNGPVMNGNGALDVGGQLQINGGFLVAVGSAGMAQSPSTASSQYSVIYNFPSMEAAGTMLHIESEHGEEVLTFTPAKDYQSVVFSSPELENGATYQLYTGGSSNGAAADGLAAGGSYTAGTQVTAFTIASIVTGEGAAMGGFGGGMRPEGGGMRPQPQGAP